MIATERIRAIIYDCDGVLIDSLRSNLAYYNHILDRFGLPPLAADHAEVVHTGTARQVIDTLFCGSVYLEAAQDYQLTVPGDKFLHLIDAEPHVGEVIRRLRDRYRTAVATNRGKSLVPVLKALGLDGLFDILVSGYDVARSKPDPECVRIILDRLGCGEEEVLYVGDSSVDRETASRAGVTFVAYKNPSLEAAVHLSDHRQLLELLGLSGRGR